MLVLLTGRTEAMHALGSRGAHRLELQGLDAASIGAWLIDAKGGAPSPSLVERIAATTSGNPLHIRQLLWRASDSDLETALAGPLPRELREAIRRRLDGLPDHAREVLDAAATAGAVFTAASVAAGLGVPVDSVLPAVEQLLADGWLQRSAEHIGCLELVHAVIRTSLYEALEPAARARLHDRMGQALIAQAEAMRGESTDQDGEIIERIAYHLTRAPAATRVGLGIEYAREAALEAFHKGAFDRCATHCVAALDAMGLVDVRHEARREIALLLASAKGRDGDLAKPRRSFAAPRGWSSEPPACVLSAITISRW